MTNCFQPLSPPPHSFLMSDPPLPPVITVHEGVGSDCGPGRQLAQFDPESSVRTEDVERTLLCTRPNQGMALTLPMAGGMLTTLQDCRTIAMGQHRRFPRPAEPELRVVARFLAPAPAAEHTGGQGGESSGSAQSAAEGKVKGMQAIARSTAYTGVDLLWPRCLEREGSHEFWTLVDHRKGWRSLQFAFAGIRQKVLNASHFQDQKWVESTLKR